MSEKPELKHAGADWREIYHALETAIKVRHYSSKTLKAYRNWTRQFQNFTKSKDQRMISVDDVKAFLSFLAVRREISASSQNQAFNALLFLFRHVLGKDFGKVEGIVRAKRKPYIPVVLSREEIDRIIGFLQYPYDLIARLLYGCGLRLSEPEAHTCPPSGPDSGIYVSLRQAGRGHPVLRIYRDLYFLRSR